MRKNIVTSYLSPFYDHGRRFVGIRPALADKYIAEGATAALDSNVVTITRPAGEVVPYPVGKMLHRRDVAEWVRKFNARAAEHRSV